MESFVAQWEVKRIISLESKVSLTHRINLIFINQKFRPLMIFFFILLTFPSSRWELVNTLIQVKVLYPIIIQPYPEYFYQKLTTLNSSKLRFIEVQYVFNHNF